jgi:hypothetical protein
MALLLCQADEWQRYANSAKTKDRGLLQINSYRFRLAPWTFWASWFNIASLW